MPILFSSPIYADQIFTGSGTSNSQAVSASVDFVVTDGFVTLTLTNTLSVAGLLSTAQLLSDIGFSVVGGETIGQQDAPANSGSLVTLADNTLAVVTTGTGTPWQFGTNDGSFGTGAELLEPGDYILTALVGNEKTMVSPTISNGSTFCTAPANHKCPDGLSNTNNNPMHNGSVTFELAIAGVEAGAKISDVTFSFGTTPEGIVTGVPIPAAVWLFGSGLLGLIGIARRRQGSIAKAPALAAV